FLNDLDNNRFRQEFRINKDSFFAICNMIEMNPVFNNTAERQQVDISIQMMVALKCLEIYGTGVTAGSIAQTIGVKGSVIKYNNRFITILLSLAKQTLFWSEQNKRNKISQRIRAQSSFPSCFRFVDGTLIKL
ncbi:hypothetical protein F4703DRAFT_1729494, partial [Phycomyces blakesleeanus]